MLGNIKAVLSEAGTLASAGYELAVTNAKLRKTYDEVA